MVVSFIAEVCSNHQQDLDRCFQLIDQAARIGCQAIKFQLFRVEQLFTAEVLKQSEKHRQRKGWELPTAFLPKLKQRCVERRIQFGCAPFYLEAVAQLQPFVDFYKIASYEILRDDLLACCAATERPIILSTGMATLQEIDRAVAVLRTNGCASLTLLHCVSSYPCAIEEAHLAVIETLRSRFGCDVGWSDHSRCASVIYRAVHRFDTTTVEFHFDLDGTGAEFSIGHCWLPEQIQPVIQTIRQGIAADGRAIKQPQPSELDEREWRAEPADGLRPRHSQRNLKQQ